MKKLNSIVDSIWPNSVISFTKKSLKYRVEEELFIFDKYKSYLGGAQIFIDVGANVGMSSLAYYFFSEGRGKILAIEPLDSCNEILTNLSKTIPQMTYLHCGAGDDDKSITLNIGKNSPTSQASSFLQFTKKYKEKFDYADVGHRQESVQIVTLNNVVNINDIKNKKTFLHIDVEGFEYSVLKGASKILPLIEIVVVEIGVELFEGQETVSNLVMLLNSTHNLIGTLGAPMMANGEILVQDYLFIRKSIE